MRYLYGSISDWSALFQEAFRSCKPGGWVESFEASAMLESDDDTVKEGSAMSEWGKFFIEGGKRLGRTFTILDDDLQKKGMEDAGFTDIQIRNFKASNCPGLSSSVCSGIVANWTYSFPSVAGPKIPRCKKLEPLRLLPWIKIWRASSCIWRVSCWDGRRMKSRFIARSFEGSWDRASIIHTVGWGLSTGGSRSKRTRICMYTALGWKRLLVHQRSIDAWVSQAETRQGVSSFQLVAQVMHRSPHRLSIPFRAHSPLSRRIIIAININPHFISHLWLNLKFI